MKLKRIMLEAQCVVRHPQLLHVDGHAASIPTTVRYVVDVRTGVCTGDIAESIVLTNPAFWKAHCDEVGRKVKAMIDSSPFASWDHLPDVEWSLD